MSGAHRSRRRTLAALVDESRRRPVPEPDWGKMEAALERRLDRLREDRGRTGAPHRLGRDFRRAVPGWRWAAAVAVLLGAVVWIVAQVPSVIPRKPGQASPIATAGDHPAKTLDGDSLPVGQRVTAVSRPVTVVHGSLARWTLEASGRAQLLVQGRLLTVGLEAGALEAEVAAGSWREAFAVEVGQTRIAVHGTRFRVERTRSGAKVTLQEGTVVIGSARDRGRTKGTLLTAPNHARVDLSGQLRPTDTLPARTRQQGSAERTVAQRRHAPSRQRRDSVASLAPADSLVAPPESSPGPPSKNAPSGAAAIEMDLAEGMDVAERAVRECFARHTHPAGGVLVTARTELTVRIAPSGAVTRIEFGPPLAPPVESCAAAALRSLDFGSSQRGGSGSRVLFLGR